ncbi:hypothetical protein IQ265_28180 [Nodosilinea sp. LEGE 06152]|uniref:hypothetical protein n=1 Tax=Nodosilinea sp. LEGE 06152 TaxID=2777966 RepID=UPI001882E414|nr:hypothetical protein [Nodosilinea sp. LEGE 06152]MBE9160671.1 hypothetical protein [Nodosilinea sp. LEGE 06152]
MSQQQNDLERQLHSLTVAVVGTIGAGLVAINPTPFRVLAGAGLCVAADAHRIRQKLTYGEIFNTFKGALNLAGESAGAELAPVGNALGRQRTQIQTAVFSQLPLAAEIAKRMEQTQALKTNGMELFAKAKSGLILGDTGDGKTQLLNYLAAAFLQVNPQGKLQIGDLDYGSSHGDAPPNTWMGLPVSNVVMIEHHDILASIIDAGEEVQRRSAATKKAIAAGEPAPKFEAQLLLIDEWVSFLSEVDKDHREPLAKALNDIVIRGKKQNVFAFLACHDASVKSLGIDQAKLSRWNVLALWKWVNQAKSTDVTNLPQGFADAQAKLKGMPRQVGETFSAIAYVDSAWSVVGVPYIDTSLMQLLPQDELLIQQFSELLATYPEDAPLSYNKAWEWLGKPSGQRTDKNPEYRAFKKVLDSIKEARSAHPPESEQAEQDG